MLIKINKYTPCPRIIRLGTSGSYGIETLEFEFNKDWEGLTKKINFFPDDAVEGVTVILGDALSCPVPAEMTASAGVGKIVAEGYDNDRRILSVTIRAMIESSAGSADKEPIKPTPSEAEQALLIAKALQNQAANGELDGKSAYEIAVDNGFEGTEAEWLKSLKGNAGLNAEMYSHKVYRVYSLDDIEKLCASRSITEFKIINCGEAFSYTSSGGDYTAINTGDIFRVSANNGTLFGLSYLDNSTVETEEGTLIEWYEPDGEDGYKARYTPVLNGIHGKDGISPTASVIQTDTGATISLTDKNGTTTAVVKNGQDGFSPTVKVSKANGITSVGFADKEGVKTAEIKDGETENIQVHSVAIVHSLVDIENLCFGSNPHYIYAATDIPIDENSIIQKGRVAYVYREDGELKFPYPYGDIYNFWDVWSSGDAMLLAWGTGTDRQAVLIRNDTPGLEQITNNVLNKLSTWEGGSY